MTKLQEQILEFCKTARKGEEIAKRFCMDNPAKLQEVYECGMKSYLYDDIRSGSYFDHIFTTTYRGESYLEEQRATHNRYKITVITSILAVILSIISIIIAALPNTVDIRSLPPVELQERLQR